MTKNRSMKIAVLVLALALLTSCFVGSTFARYTSSGAGSANVQAAYWGFTVNGDDIVASDTFDFDLTVSGTTITPDNATHGTNVRFAPGTNGTIVLELANNSEVNAVYDVDFSAVIPKYQDTYSLPIEFSTTNNGSDWSATVPTNITATINAGATTTVTLYWQWAMESGNDAADTYFGVNKSVVELGATVTATQAD